MSQSTFDETLPWGKLPYFIKHSIYWQVMVKKRNEMGWKALHEQLFPFRYKKQRCWDCDRELTMINTMKDGNIDLYRIVFQSNSYYNFPLLFHFRCPHCKLTGRRKIYHVIRDHEELFSRSDVPVYKIHVFGYLVYSAYQPRSCHYIGHSLLTGYHVSREPIGAKVLTRYYDEETDYTRRLHIFRPIFLWTEVVATFA